MSKKRGQPKPAPRDFHFYSFPTFAGFSLGLLVALALFVAGLGPLLPLITMFCISFSFAHLVTRYFTRRRVESQREKTDEEERERRALAAREAAAPQAEPARRRRRRRR
jgi:membrane protein implicated in regulation of membrane protease activity